MVLLDRKFYCILSRFEYILSVIGGFWLFVGFSEFGWNSLDFYWLLLSLDKVWLVFWFWVGSPGCCKISRVFCKFYQELSDFVSVCLLSLAGFYVFGDRLSENGSAWPEPYLVMTVHIYLLDDGYHLNFNYL